MSDLTQISTIRLVEAYEEPRTVPAAEAIDVGDVVSYNSGGALVAARATTGPILPKGMALNASLIYGHVDVVRDALLDVGNILGGLAFGALVYTSDTAGLLSDASVNSLAAIGEVVPAHGVITTYDKLLRLKIGAR
jgi:hypothetical protein